MMVERQYSDRASPSTQRRRRGVGEGRAAPWRMVRLPSPHPSIYRGKGEGGRPPRTHLVGCGGQGERGRGWLAPQAKGGAPSRVPPSTLGAWAQGRGCGQPTRGWLPARHSPCGPPGGVAPPGGPPEPFRWPRYNTGMTPKLPGVRLTTSHI